MLNPMAKPFNALGVALAAALGAAPVAAQDWPTRPVTLVVPFAAGGPIDSIGRILASSLSEALRQQMIVENIGGAGGMTGTARVAKAPPDGYQVVLGNVGTHAGNQTMYRRPLYNAATDFAPVILVVELPLVLLARKDFPAADVPAFIAYAKANQASMQFGSGGAGSATHLACALFNAAAGIEVAHVPYRGGAPAMQDLIAGRIDYLCVDTPIALPQIESGTVKPLAVLSRGRSPSLPALASAHEQGLADFAASNWAALFLPKGTPAPIVAKLHATTVAAMETPSLQGQMKNVGADLVAPERRSSAYLQMFVESEIEKWAAPIKASGLHAD
jgi:tripartite-type tricarboxylate transporter receptor subunit TctC